METPVLSLLLFAFVATITPGPNNVMVAASAARHGLRATVPHMAGIAVGFAAMIALVGLGLGEVILRAPAVAAVLRMLALGWLLVLAWRIARAGAPGEGQAGPPLGFFGAAAFQWVNPKAWLMAVSANAVFILPDRPLGPQFALVALVFLVPVSYTHLTLPTN